MCVTVKLPKALNPEAEEWRPACAPPAPLPLLPHTLIRPAPPPISEGNQYNKKMKMKMKMKMRPKRFLPPRLRRRASTSKNAPPPPPPPKLEWRPKTAPPPPATARAKTTLMIRNIPNQLRRAFMLKFLDGYCRTHSFAYDFFYLPIDFRRLGNLGYAFVNFTTAGAAEKMKKILRSYKWHATYTDDGEFVLSNKVGEITWARIQGKEALVRRFAKSNFNCDDEEFLPVVLDPPRNGSDPNPPRPITLGRLCGQAQARAR